MWDAAEPATTWGFPLRIISTTTAKIRFFSNLLKRFIEETRLVIAYNAYPSCVKEGLVDKILRKKATEEDKQKWLEQKRAKCRDENQWLQEYCCVAVDETTALLPYDLISPCEKADVLKDAIQGDFYVGMDIGRRRDLSVIWGLERLGSVLYARIYKVIKGVPFRTQRDVLFSILSHPNLRRACIDATGLGMQLAEEAQDKFGKYRVEAVTFTPAVKEQLAMALLPLFEDKQIYIPEMTEVREDLHSVRKIVSAGGNVRFDSSSSETDGHSDRFWALALAVHAGASKLAQPYFIGTRRKRESFNLLWGYE
jgi:phage FluMu gp28-like protein